jgi:hypothetical protein
MYLDSEQQALYDILLFDKGWFNDLCERIPGFSALGSCLKSHVKCIKCFNEEKWYEIYDFLDGNGFIVEWPDPDSSDINTYVILWPQYPEPKIIAFDPTTTISTSINISSAYYASYDEIAAAENMAHESVPINIPMYYSFPMKLCFQNSKNIKVVREAARPPP